MSDSGRIARRIGLLAGEGATILPSLFGSRFGAQRDVAQPGSAPEWGSGGRGFKSRRPDLINQGTVGIYADGAFSLLPNLRSYDSEGFDSCQVSVFFERKDFFVAVPFRVRLENMTGLRVEPL